MAQQSSACACSSNSHRASGTLDGGREDALKPKHKVFLSHSGFQKGFVEHLCLELEGCFRFPFFDKRRESLPIGENFPGHIFDAIRQCDVGVVILSEEFFTSKWPMMELVAMHDRVLGEAEKGKSMFKIIPVFLRTSLKEFDDPVTRSRWLSCWRELAQENSERVQVEKWEAAVKYLRSISGMVYDGLGEVRFEKDIADEICKVVPPEIRLEDSHIQGKTRLCKVIQDKMNALQEKKNDGVCVVGLYGMGGVGKTSICKALCNEFVTKFRGRVCHAELERGSQEELLREVLKSLTKTSGERLDGLNVDQLWSGLKEGMIKDAVFLALDNMSDSDASINEVKSYLSGRFPAGSIVMVTARSKDWLERVRPYIDESNYMEMPKLMLEEAKCLFAQSSDLEWRKEVDEKLILRCVKRCYFRKEDGEGSSHFHPLALDVLGRQLARLPDLKDWKALLDRIDEDIFNQSREKKHPVFSILRWSFDALAREDQMLFMDVALFLPNFGKNCWSAFEWLGVVHNIPTVNDVMRALERLRSKSLLEMVGDGFETRIGMHDLWRAFCVAETKSGELGRRRWYYESTEFVGTSPPGPVWKNVKRMAFLGPESISLEKVNFTHFFNVTVLKISTVRMSRTEKIVVDLSGLIHLKSLDVDGARNLVIQGLPRDLISLNFDERDFVEKPLSQQLVPQIACRKELQCLRLMGYGGRVLPDMRNMLSLRVAIFSDCENVVKVSGLSSQLTNLRVLSLAGCLALRSCLGVGDLVGLEELECRGCERLERFPNLRKLRNLRKLDVGECELITELPGLGDLVALEELYARSWSNTSFKLPVMSKLNKLQVLDLGERILEAAPGFDCLISLRELEANFQKVSDWPNLGELTKLRVLKIYGWSVSGLRGLDKLTMLDTLLVGGCRGVDELPDFRSLITLRTLNVENCEFKDVSSLSNVSSLESLRILECRKLERLPHLPRLTRLESLRFIGCDMPKGWDPTLGLGGESSCALDECNVQVDRLESQRLMGLRTLRLFRCINLADMTCVGAFSQLESLFILDLPVRELPDLSNFPRLKTLNLYMCHYLTRVTSSEPLPALECFELVRCSGVKALPDLGMFPSLHGLVLSHCSKLSTVSSSGLAIALKYLTVSGCRSLSQDDLDHLRALCGRHCRIEFDEEVNDEVIINKGCGLGHILRHFNVLKKCANQV